MAWEKIEPSTLQTGALETAVEEPTDKLKGMKLAGEKMTVDEQTMVQEIIDNRLQLGTKVMYKRAYEGYVDFKKRATAPADEGEAILAYLAQIFTKKDCTVSSIRVIWAGIRSTLAENNVIIEATQVYRIQKLLAGMKKMSRPSKTPQPLKLQQLNHLIKKCRKMDERQQVIIAGITLMWWGLMRISELIEQPNTKGRYLAMSDMQLTKRFVPVIGKKITTADRLELTIRSSKTDPSGQGETHWFGKSNEGNGPLEAAILIKMYAQKNGCSTDSKYQDVVKPSIENKDITQMLEEGAEGQNLTTHAMRRGGACHLVQSGVPWTSIKVLGRWKTDSAPQLYTRNFNALNIDRVKTVASGKVVKVVDGEEAEM